MTITVDLENDVLLTKIILKGLYKKALAPTLFHVWTRTVRCTRAGERGFLYIGRRQEQAALRVVTLLRTDCVLRCCPLPWFVSAFCSFRVSVANSGKRLASSVFLSTGFPLLPKFKDVFVVDVPSSQVETVSNCVGKVLKCDLPIGSRTLRKGSEVLQTWEEREADSVPLISPTRLPFAQWPQGERGFLYIGRRFRDRRGVLRPASFWQNPFGIRDCKSRSEALFKFRAHLPTLSIFPQCFRELSGVRLACHCQLVKRAMETS